MKQRHTSSVNVESWPRKSIKDETTTLGNTCIGNLVRNIILIQKQDGMTTHRVANKPWKRISIHCWLPSLTKRHS